MSDVILEMRNITKEFPGVKALDDVNLVVERGTIWWVKTVQVNPP